MSTTSHVHCLLYHMVNCCTNPWGPVVPSGAPGSAHGPLPFLSSEQDGWLTCVLPLCTDKQTQKDLNLPKYVVWGEPDHPHVPLINFSGGINIFGLLISFLDVMQTISNTSIVSVHTFLMTLPVVAKGFARYNKVLINFQTIVSGVCLSGWGTDMQLWTHLLPNMHTVKDRGPVSP